MALYRLMDSVTALKVLYVHESIVDEFNKRFAKVDALILEIHGINHNFDAITEKKPKYSRID
jgi:hypothetical protein